MMKTIEQRVAEEINETPAVVAIGKKTFSVRPLTLGQLIDMSAVISTLKDIRQDDQGRDCLSVTLEHISDLEKMVDIALIVLFRTQEEREPNRKFIRENLGEAEMARLQELYIERLNSPFFLTNIIFLKGLNLTKPTRTTAPGPSGMGR